MTALKTHREHFPYLQLNNIKTLRKDNNHNHLKDMNLYMLKTPKHSQSKN